MLIKSLEQKTKLAFLTVTTAILGSAAVSIYSLWRSTEIIQSERNQIYVLDGDIPFLAERAQLETNFEMEARAHIQQFHHYFFNLAPDDHFIEWSLGRALYMADASALKQKQSLDEKGFYNDIVSASATVTLICDSINFDPHTKEFTYYGTQTIKRRSANQRRSLTTSGVITNTQRSQNNPHGLLVTSWKTLENKII